MKCSVLMKGIVIKLKVDLQVDVCVCKNEMYMYVELHKYIKAIIFLATVMCCTGTDGNGRCYLPVSF